MKSYLQRISGYIFAYAPIGASIFFVGRFFLFLRSSHPLDAFLHTNCTSGKTSCLDFGPIRKLFNLIFGQMIVGMQSIIQKGMYIGFMILSIIFIGLMIYVAFMWLKSLYTFPKSVGLVFRTYFSFLSHYRKQNKIWMIIRTHWFFLVNIFAIGWVPRSGKELHIFRVPFELKNTIERLNTVLSSRIKKDIYAVAPFVITPDVISFHVSEGENSGETVKNALLNQEDELLRLFPGFDDANKSYDMLVEKKRDNIFVRFTKKDIWTIQDLNPDKRTIERGRLLLGFYPEIHGKGIECKEYTIDPSGIEHIVLIGATRRGKDVVQSNITWSILAQNKRKLIFDLEFFDTKLSDAIYLQNLESYGIKRHIPEGNNYLEALRRIESEMEERYKTMGSYGKLSAYRKANPNTDIREKFVIINELMDVIAKFRNHPEGTDAFIDCVNSLISKGAGAGVHVVLMSHTLRKDLVSGFAKILANVSTKIIVQMIDEKEMEIAVRGLDSQSLERLKNLTRYNALHIFEGKIQKEIRGFMIEPDDLARWTYETFGNEEATKQAEAEKTESSESKKNRYLEHIEKTGTISYREATSEPFNLSRSEWNQIIQTLESDGRIKRNIDRSISPIPKEESNESEETKNDSLVD